MSEEIDDIVTITIPRAAAKWYADRGPKYGTPCSLAIWEACRVALWTPKVGDIVQTRSAGDWFPRAGFYNVHRRVVIDVTDRHVVTRDTDDGELRAARIEDTRLDERPEPEGGWDTAWWDECQGDYLDGER